MSHEDAQRKFAAAARYRALARYTQDDAVRTALRETAAELEGLASAAADLSSRDCLMKTVTLAPFRGALSASHGSARLGDFPLSTEPRRIPSLKDRS